MIVIEGHHPIPDIKNAIVTSGTFDGVHLGHQKILKRIVSQAKEVQGKSVVLTYWPHPRIVLFPEEKTLKLLSTFEERAQMLEEVGIDYLIKVKFTKEFSELTSESFIQGMLVEKLHTKKLVIGYDHRFGKNRQGSFAYLKSNSERFGFEVEEIDRQDIDDVGVSSTKIRQALFHGEVNLAAEFMGRPYSISGMVAEGNKIGRGLGFPTANIIVEEKSKLIPKDGAYAVYAKVKGKTFQAMLNIGVRPTVDGLNKVVEAHLFDFDEEIYNERIEIYFAHFLRDEVKFESTNELKDQLAQDKKATLSLLRDIEVS